MDLPRPLFCLFSFFSITILQKNCRPQRDSNSDHRSRRRARWPLDHHHGPLLNILSWGGSPAVVGMGEYSCSKSCGFESQHRILDTHFSHLFDVKIVMFVWKKNINKKEAGVGPFKKSIQDCLIFSLCYCTKEQGNMPRGMFCQAKKIERKEIIKALMWEKRSILLDAFETELPTFYILIPNGFGYNESSERQKIAVKRHLAWARRKKNLQRAFWKSKSKPKRKKKSVWGLLPRRI